MTIRRFTHAWEGLIEPAWMGDAKERRLARLLNIILLLFLILAIGLELLYRSDNQPPGRGDLFAGSTIVILVLVYALNRRGYLTAATVLTVGLFVISMFVFALMQHANGAARLTVLYYLIVPVLMGELFFSLRGYLTTITVILAGVLAVSMLNPSAETSFVFLFVFCTLIGVSSYSRRQMDQEQSSLIQRFAREQYQLSREQRKSAQLSLLAEVGRQVMNSFDEKEILERTLDVVVKNVGYAQAVISLLADEDALEVAAIAGTQDFGYRPGFRQRLGSGIIGHVAKTRTAYFAGDVSEDPYYFSLGAGHGSAIGVPMLDEGQLLGVIYVESDRKDELREDDVETLQTLANQVATSLEKSRLHVRTQEHLQVMTTLQSISQTVASSLELNEILSNVIRLLKDSFGYTYLSIYLLEADILRMGAQLGYPEGQLMPEIPITAGVTGRAARSKQTQVVRDVDSDVDFLRASYEVKSEIAVPLIKNDIVLGVLNVESDRHRLLDETDIHLLNALAGTVAVAIDNARLHAEVKRMAMTDVISGLANRRAFDEIIEAELLRASRYRHPLSLIILDLDSFKEYNDRWGHPAGDARLREIADLLRANVRDPDQAARYGGEEFAIILPNTSKSGAIRLADRLCHSAQASAPEKQDGHCPIPGYTISLGVATYPDDAGSVAELLLMADNAELMAKRLGKNRVHAADTENKIQNP